MILCQEDPYLKELVGHIHLNPFLDTDLHRLHADLVIFLIGNSRRVVIQPKALHYHYVYFRVVLLKFLTTNAVSLQKLRCNLPGVGQFYLSIDNLAEVEKNIGAKVIAEVEEAAV